LASDESSELLRELKAVKMLLILQAMTLGCQQKHVAAALGVSEATLSRMLPKGLGKDLARVSERRFGTEPEA
jgi:DNA-binding transcriptional regulator LsrR (DeoR family)